MEMCCIFIFIISISSYYFIIVFRTNLIIFHLNFEAKIYSCFGRSDFFIIRNLQKQILIFERDSTFSGIRVFEFIDDFVSCVFCQLRICYSAYV